LSIGVAHDLTKFENCETYYIHTERLQSALVRNMISLMLLHLPVCRVW